jgi:hypothetical protein
MRTALGGICLAVMWSACAPRTIDLQGDAGVNEPDAGTVDAGVHEPDASTVPPVPVSTPQSIVTCTSPSDTAATLGEGYTSDVPSACNAPQGTPKPVTSAADVAALLVGLWYDCSGSSFGGIEASMLDDEHAFELTADGHYVAYGRQDGQLLPLAQVAAAYPADAGIVEPAATGTYTVVDGSATYGAGTYQLQFHPSVGGVFEGQVIVTTNPVQLVYLVTNQNAAVFAPARTWGVRKGVCSCVNLSETPQYEDDPTDLANAIVGKWMWCDGPSAPADAPGGVGIEFDPGNIWYALIQDDAGNVSRSTAGTYQIAPKGSGLGFNVGPEPLNISLSGTTGGGITQLLYFPNPRVLFFGVGTTGTPGSPITNLYSICFPMP